MRNPSRKPQPPSWREIVGTIYRGIRRGRKASGGGRKARARWIAGGLLCVALAVGISLAALARERSAKKEAVPATGSNATGKAVPAAAKITKRNEGGNAENTRAAAKEPGEENAGAGRNTKGEAASAESQEAAGQDAGPAAKTEGEKESPDLVRARAAWFYDQRAYPLQHIPQGALQKAIQQRDAMKARQRAAATPQLGTNGIISFPGDALWHLMGPQPVDEPFSVNTGFPTASGRVTAIAPDPTDATGQTVYIGGAAGGVWKTTDGGAHWTPLTDSQPSLAVGSIAIDPNNHNIIYVGTGEEDFGADNFYGAGILKSTDGGTTWTQVGASTFAQVLGPQTGGAFIGSIAVQPGNSSIVLAAVSFFVNGTVGGIYRSTDGGATWTEDAAPAA